MNERKRKREKGNSQGVSTEYSVLTGGVKIMSIGMYIKPREATEIPEPKVARFLFADTRMAWLWLIVRIYVGYQWLTAGFEKLTGYNITVGSSCGTKAANPWALPAHKVAAL